MNKIFNWLFGACFRTLGRFLAIFIVGMLLVFIGSKIGFELPDWLGIAKVSASTIVEPVEYWADEKLTISNNDAWVTDWGKFFVKTLTSDTSNVSLIYHNLDFNYSNFSTGHDYAVFDFTFTQPKANSNSTTNYIMTCTNYECNEFDTDGTTCISWSCNQYELNDVIINDTYNTAFNSFSFNPVIQLEDGLSYSCSIQNNSIVCPIHKKRMKSLRFYFNFTTFQGTSIRYGVSNTARYYNLISIGNIQQNQQETNDKLDDMNQTQNDIKDSINNNNTSDAQNSASGFFDNFSTETFGLTSIITAPLNAINSLINSSCTNLILPLPFVDKNLTLPCMTSIYSNYFKDFFDLYQIITTGLISYYIIVRIFNLVKDFKNPEHDEIEVMDL